MSGHSKWANIKRRKAVVDAQKGRVFSRFAREITVAARQGGPNPDANASLKVAIERAREQNLPMDNIQRAIQRGAGGPDGQSYEEVTYEGYGPGGVAVYVEGETDNRNRTAADVRHVFSRHGGNLGESGCVAWMFDALGQIFVPIASTSEDRLLEAALEAGATDLRREEEHFVVTTAPEDLIQVQAALEGAEFQVDDAEVTRVPKVRTEVHGEDAAKLLRMLEALEEHDDVQKVHANFDIDDSELEALTGA